MRLPRQAQDARSQLRFRVSVRGQVSATTMRRHSCEATDISTHGCRLNSPFSYPLGSTVVVTFPGLRPLGARVCWSNNEAVGLRFHAPLHGAVIDHLVATCPAA